METAPPAPPLAAAGGKAPGSGAGWSDASGSLSGTARTDRETGAGAGSPSAGACASHLPRCFEAAGRTRGRSRIS